MPTCVLHFETTGSDDIAVPFDQPEHADARYTIDLRPESAQDGDGIVLVANSAGYRALAILFAQLAEGGYPAGYHVHLGYSHGEPQGPGWRLTLDEPPTTSSS